MLLALQLELCRGLALPFLDFLVKRLHEVCRPLRHVAYLHRLALTCVEFRHEHTSSDTDLRNGRHRSLEPNGLLLVRGCGSRQLLLES